MKSSFNNQGRFSNGLLFHTKFKLRLFEFLLPCNGFVKMQMIKTSNVLLAINVLPIPSSTVKLGGITLMNQI